MHRHESRRLIALAVRVLGGPGAAHAWIDRPNVQLGGRTPREMIGSEEGLRRVEELLAQLDDDQRSSPC